MKRVTGLGGIFFKANGPAAELQAWYCRHLGLEVTEGQGIFWNWKSPDEAATHGETVFSIFKADSAYLEPGKEPFMINFRVENLHALLAVLKDEGVVLVGEPVEVEYGKFAWILDPEGRKIELWEPAPGYAFPGGMNMK